MTWTPEEVAAVRKLYVTVTNEDGTYEMQTRYTTT